MSSYQAAYPWFEERNAHVLGVSPDASPSKVAWAKSLGGIAFDLLSDFHPQNAVARLYGVERAGGVPERALFVVDKAGHVAFARVYEIGAVPDSADLGAVLERLNG
jgi:peroxiredoxin